MIELVLGLTISLFILIILSSIYITTLNSFNFQASLNEIAQNADSAFNFLTQDIRYAGFIGCPRFSPDFPITNHSKYIFQPITGNSNSLQVMHASTQSTILVTDMSDAKNLIVAGDPIFQAGDVVLISDCKAAEIFTIDSVQALRSNKTILTADASLTHLFKRSAEISLLVINTYYIQATHRKTSSGKPISALYLKNIKQRKSELVEGVDSMELTYEHSSLDRIGVQIKLTLSSTQARSLSKVWYGYAVLQ